MPTRMAVLVDGDNIGAQHASEIARIAAQHGPAQVMRVYLDAQRPSDWHATPGFRLVHAGSGKNASDILLSIDALALALRDGVNSFVIASSDRDFSHIAMRLREYGAAVAGIGEAKAPAAFRQACQSFVQIGPAPTAVCVPKPAGNPSKLDEQIRAVIAEHSEKGTGILIAKLGSAMHARHKTQIGATPEKSWRAYLNTRPALYDLDPRGPHAHVRFRPGGFGARVANAAPDQRPAMTQGIAAE
jgi:NYN domain